MNTRTQGYKRFEIRGRFMVEPSEDGYNVIDNLDSTYVDFPTITQAKEFATFCRDYVRKHGDIDLSAVPYNLDSTLVYDRGTERPWSIE